MSHQGSPYVLSFLIFNKISCPFNIVIKSILSSPVNSIETICLTATFRYCDTMLFILTVIGFLNTRYLERSDNTTIIC